MVAEDIEKIKRDYTDKYVVVDASRPELARFRDHVGQVKTVNMSGRALVEFIDFHLNIGWHDIDLDYLKVVDKPAPKEEKPAARKPAAAPAAPAAKKQAEAAPGGKKLSPLEMARMQGGAKKAGDAPAEKPKPAKPAGGKMSVAEMMAAARAEKTGGATAAPAPAATPEPAAEPPAAAAPAKSAKGVAKVDRASMSIADMLAYCRQKDAK